MGETGKAMMGTGEASGENRAIEAAEKAISNPLLDGVSMKGAKGVIISITGGEDMKLMEVDEAASHIKELVDPDANIIWGSAFNNALDGKIRVSVVATGIEAEHASMPSGQQGAAAKVFSFPPRGTVAAPATATFVPPLALDNEANSAVEDDDTLELTSEDEADELVLDSDDILTQPVASAPVPPPADEDEPMAEEAERPKLATGGGTLFERMSNISRGAAQAQSQDGEPMPSFRREPLDIPRFLNRQNNQ
jgi:cell division protein FtsZ